MTKHDCEKKDEFAEIFAALRRFNWLLGLIFGGISVISFFALWILNAYGARLEETDQQITELRQERTATNDKRTDERLQLARTLSSMETLLKEIKSNQDRTITRIERLEASK